MTTLQGSAAVLPPFVEEYPGERGYAAGFSNVHLDENVLPADFGHDLHHESSGLEAPVAGVAARVGLSEGR